MLINKKFLRVLFSAVFSILTLSACLVPDNSYLMELNRQGKWAQAAGVGIKMLENSSNLSHSERCETCYHIAYARTRMGRKPDAVIYLDEYDRISAEQPLEPELRWLPREVFMLKKELGLLDERQSLLADAMEENKNGNYKKAYDLCLRVLAERDATEIQQATAHFVASVCSLRSGNIESAQLHFDAYLELRPFLPPGNQMLSEERLLAEDIEKSGGN